MIDPRSPSRSGLSSQGSLLLVLGLGAAVFLFFLFPRLTPSRAAESRSRRLEAPGKEQRLPDEVEPAPTAAAELRAIPEMEAEAPAAAPTAPVPNAEALLAVEDPPRPKPEEPKLKYQRLGGKPDVIEAGALRAEQRERRRERLAREAEQAAAFGGDVPARSQPRSANGERVEKSRGGGKGNPERGKGRDQKRKPQGG